MTEEQNPYVGLRPFFLKDSLHFFGREAQTAELLAVLRQHRFLGVVGSSGSGKSSLVRAGLLPALFGGFLVGDRDRWRIVQIKPGDTPVRNLAAGLLGAFSEAPPADAEIVTLEAAIRDDQADAVVAFVKERLTARESVFLLVDQFEEVFAFRRAGDEERAEAADFVALLMALADEQPEVPVFVALTMRTDFLGDCDLFYGLPEILNRGQYLVPRLTRQQLRLAIEGPAMLTGARVAPQLMDLLLNQLGDREDRLPVIQHALLRTWDAWHMSGATGPIEVRHFEEAGGLENALNIDAEAALAEVTAALPAVDAGVIARVFKALTDTDLSHRAVRRPARVHELMAASGADRATVDTILRCFSHKNRNFLYADDWQHAPDPRVDISHESLIRQWIRLRDWVADEREMRDQFTTLVARARSWQKHGVALQGNELKSADAWWRSAQPSAPWARRYADKDDDFAIAQQHLTTSIQARRWTRVTRFVSAAVVVAAVAGALMYQQQSQAKRALETERLRNMEGHATALLERDPESAIVGGLIAAAAHDRLYPGVGVPVALESTLMRAWQESALKKTQQLAFTGDARYALLSSNGRVVMLGGTEAVGGGEGVMVFDVGTGTVLAAQASGLATQERERWCNAFTPDGGRLNFTQDSLSGQWSIKSGADGKVQQFDKNLGRLWMPCAYSPDAARIALVSRARDGLDWTLTLASVSDERVTKERDINLATNADEATALRFSRSGDAVAVAVRGSDTKVFVFNARTGVLIKRFTTANRVTDLAVSQEGEIIVTVEDAFSYVLYVRRLDEDAPPTILPNSARNDNYSAIDVSPDGQELAAANGETVSVWDLNTGLDTAVFRGHRRTILAVMFDAEGQLVTVGQDGDLRVWRGATRDQRAFHPSEHLNSAVLSSSGRVVFTVGDRSGMSGWAADRPLEAVPPKFSLPNAVHLALSPDGRTLAALTSAETIVLLDATSGRLLTEVRGGSLLGRLAFSPDGRRLALADGGHVWVWTLPPPGADPYHLAEPVVIPGGGKPKMVFDAVAFSPDAAGRQIATANHQEVFLWNAATGACEARFEARSEVFSVAYTPGGEQIATGEDGGRVRLWPVAAAMRVGCMNPTLLVPPDVTLHEHSGPVRAITFVGDGSRFATASEDRTAKVWDTKSGQVLLTLRHARAVTSAAFSSDGRRLLTNVDDQGAKVWIIPLRAEIISDVLGRVTRECLSTEERQRFFPGTPVDGSPCLPTRR